jgi:hypothetical protein
MTSERIPREITAKAFLQSIVASKVEDLKDGTI